MAANKCGITDAVLNWVKFKQQEAMEKKSGKKTSNVKVEKLVDAHDAGTRNAHVPTFLLPLEVVPPRWPSGLQLTHTLTCGSPCKIYRIGPK